MLKQVMRHMLTLTLLSLFVQAWPVMAEGNQDAEEINQVLIRYKDAVNARNQADLVATYDNEAMVKATINGKNRLYKIDEYERALPQKFKEWESSSVKILTFDVTELSIAGDKAVAYIKAKGQRYFFSGNMEGKIELRKLESQWKIILDEL